MIGTALVAAVDDRNRDRLSESAAVVEEIMGTSDKAVPQDLLDKSECLVVVPAMKKAGFIVGGKYGKGYMLCRKPGADGWGAPGAMRIEGGSFGFQIGGSETDIILLVLNESGVNKLLSSKFTVGGEGSVAAGPVGRDATAQTDLQMRAEILSYSRSRGVFAGIALTGATLRQDLDDNQAMYGKKLENREIVKGTMPAPAEAGKLISILNKYSPRKVK
jgi:lipid-binding SYLF domain-containing protein